MPLGIDSTVLAAIITGVVTFAVGVIVAFYGPRFSERAQTNKLKKGLYRELVNWYELIRWYLKYYDLRSQERLFIIESAFPSGKQLAEPPEIGRSIKQSEKSPAIGRPGRRDLQFKIEKLHEIFSRLSKEMLVTSLYLQTLGNEELLQRLYHIKESFPLSQLYEDFLLGFHYEFEPHVYLAQSQFLTKKEGNELSLLEYRLDWLRSACASFDDYERKEELDARLLDRLRRGKPRGILVSTTGAPHVTARWCTKCNIHSEPVKPILWRWLMGFSITHDFYFEFLKEPECPDPERSQKVRRATLINAFNRFREIPLVHIFLIREHCRCCRRGLPTVNELTARLSCSDSQRELEIAVNVLAKTFEYNTVDFNRDVHFNPLIATFEDENQDAIVHKAAINALKQVAIHGFLDDLSEARERLCLAINKLLHDIKVEVSIREIAIEIVGELYKNSSSPPPHVIIEPLLQALSDTSDQMRIAAAKAIRLIGDETLVGEVYDGLRYASGPVAEEQVVRALGRLGRGALPSLVDVLNDERIGPKARAKAARSLGNMGLMDEVWQELTQKAQDTSCDFDLREGVREALTWLEPQHQEQVRQMIVNGNG